MRSVAITGFGVVSPVGTGQEAFWQNLSDGRSGIGPLTRFDASSFEVRLGGEVRDMAALTGPTASLVRDDPKIGFAVQACREAMSRAGLTTLKGNTILHLGTSLEFFDLTKIVVNGKPDFRAVTLRSLQPEARPLQMPLDTASRVLQSLYGSPQAAYTNCSACAAGAQAIGQGFHAIRSGRAEIAVCGAFDSMINPLGVGGFQLLGALSLNNGQGAFACRPFDAERGGTVLGEGAAIVVLEPVDKARAEGKQILAEICGYGSTLDAHSLSAPDPAGSGAMRAMRQAIADAGLTPEAIGHINAHGTGTQLNDEVEARAIRQVFPNWEQIPVSATKSMTGHLIAAAGAVEVGACLLALHRNQLPPNISLKNVAAGCELNHVCAAGQGFDGEYALTNSFGFGGQNATLVLRRGKN